MLAGEPGAPPPQAVEKPVTRAKAIVVRRNAFRSDIRRLLAGGPEGPGVIRICVRARKQKDPIAVARPRGD